jgi:hypothetical protein
MVKGECLFFFRVGWKVFNKSPTSGWVPVLTWLPFVHPHKKKAGKEAQVEHLPTKCEALSSNSSTAKREREKD